jgi:hypothetical protein
LLAVKVKLQNQLEKLSKLACSSDCIITIDPGNTELNKTLLERPPMVAGVAAIYNASTGQYSIKVLFNGIAIHSPPMALSFVMNALLGVDTCNDH